MPGSSSPCAVPNFPCIPLSASSCAANSSAQGQTICALTQTNVTHAVCGATERWVDSDQFHFRECFSEDGGLIGVRQLTDQDGSADNDVAGQWTSSGVSDAGIPGPLDPMIHQGC